MPIPSAEEFAIEVIKEFHSRANPKSETHRTIGQRIARMIKERDEAIRQGEYTRVAHEWISKHPEINE